jgi:Spy/CpxP family protein refolding chaperone
MKKSLLKLFAVSAMATSLMLGQNPGTPGNSSGTPPTPADMAQRRVNMLTTVLGLTTAQQQQASTIFTNMATAEATLRASMKAAHQTLNDAVKTNNLAAIDQASTAIGNLTAQSTSTSAKARAAFYQILTADQQAKLSQMQSQGHGFGGPGGWRRGAGAAGFGGHRQ